MAQLVVVDLVLNAEFTALQIDEKVVVAEVLDVAEEMIIVAAGPEVEVADHARIEVPVLGELKDRPPCPWYSASPRSPGRSGQALPSASAEGMRNRLATSVAISQGFMSASYRRKNLPRMAGALLPCTWA